MDTIKCGMFFGLCQNFQKSPQIAAQAATPHRVVEISPHARFDIDLPKLGRLAKTRYALFLSLNGPQFGYAPARDDDRRRDV